MQIGDSVAAYDAFMAAPPRVLEGSVAGCYGNLDNVPGQGLNYILRLMAGSARRGDVFRVPPSMADITREFLAHLAACGVDAPAESDIFWSDEYGAAVRSFPERHAEFFMFNHLAHQIRPDEARLKATWGHENKCALGTRWGNGGKMPPTVVVHHGKSPQQRLNPHSVWQLLGGLPVRLKIGISAAGTDNILCRDPASMVQAFDRKPWKSADFVVQRQVGDIDASVNYRAEESGVNFLFVTRQLVAGGSAHKGNIHDPSLEKVCRALADEMAFRAWQEGVRGFFGFDLRVLSDKSRAWVIECNARFTAPIYGWLIASQLKVPCWAVVNLENLPEPTIEGSIPRPLLYDSVEKVGVVCHNPGPLINEAACSVTVLAPSRETLMSLLRDLRPLAHFL